MAARGERIIMTRRRLTLSIPRRSTRKLHTKKGWLRVKSLTANCTKEERKSFAFEDLIECFYFLEVVNFADPKKRRFLNKD